MKSLLKATFFCVATMFLIPFLQSPDPVIVTIAGLTETGVVLSLVAPYVESNILAMNSQAARMVFENAKAAINKAFPIPVDRPRQQASEICKLTQSYLRLEQLLLTTSTTYTFPVLINQGAQFNTEQRLNQQDSFIISEVAMFIARPTGAADSTFLPDTYLNPFLYTNAVAMQVIYSSSLKIVVNGDVLIPVWDMARHYYAPETQATAAAGAGSPIDQRRLAVDSFYPMEPNIVLIGSKKNEITVSMPVAPTAVDANSRLIIFLRGVLAQNSTAVS